MAVRASGLLLSIAPPRFPSLHRLVSPELVPASLRSTLFVAATCFGLSHRHLFLLPARFLQRSRQGIVIVIVGKLLESVCGLEIFSLPDPEDQLIQEPFIAMQSRGTKFRDQLRR